MYKRELVKAINELADMLDKPKVTERARKTTLIEVYNRYLEEANRQEPVTEVPTQPVETDKDVAIYVGIGLVAIATLLVFAI